MRLRYTGPVPTTFQDLSLEIQPGGEFSVPDEEAERYTRRSDIEEVTAAVQTTAAKKTDSAPVADAAN